VPEAARKLASKDPPPKPDKDEKKPKPEPPKKEEEKKDEQKPSCPSLRVIRGGWRWCSTSRTTSSRQPEGRVSRRSK
jgi:hypothetical protein